MPKSSNGPDDDPPAMLVDPATDLCAPFGEKKTVDSRKFGQTQLAVGESIDDSLDATLRKSLRSSGWRQWIGTKDQNKHQQITPWSAFESLFTILWWFPKTSGTTSYPPVIKRGKLGNPVGMGVSKLENHLI